MGDGDDAGFERGCRSGEAAAVGDEPAVLAERFLIPTRRDITPRLLVGAGLFGIGWSIGGFCPGPAITAVGSGMQQAFIFLPAMVVGMLLEQLYSNYSDRRRATVAASSDGSSSNKAAA